MEYYFKSVILSATLLSVILNGFVKIVYLSWSTKTSWLLRGVCDECARRDQHCSERHACSSARSNDEWRLCWKGVFDDYLVGVGK